MPRECRYSVTCRNRGTQVSQPLAFSFDALEGCRTWAEGEAVRREDCGGKRMEGVSVVLEFRAQN